jgi:hypothetical protein
MGNQNSTLNNSGVAAMEPKRSRRLFHILNVNTVHSSATWCLPISQHGSDSDPRMGVVETYQSRTSSLALDRRCNVEM